MERYKKKDILQALATLSRANDSISRAAEKNPSEALTALEQCQESAIRIGTFLEKSDEKYIQMVSALEDYCENIYQMSIHISDENKCRKLSKKIRKQLIGLQSAITNDMPEDRKEVVFLPYKASMWDSLESVWKDADADENTDAYVIPIPYYDKNPDGSFREEHYEGEMYPSYVPVIRYDAYDFEERRPDMIFIHNPYDECNHVTSVHPYFYSKNLKQFTEKLIYIPYFILHEINPEDQAAVSGIKHFCLTPGVVNADRVIVQSENMRRIYINVLMEYTGGDEASRKYWEEKILGLGSPKVDKVLRTKKEELEVPEEWLKVIRKPDGNRKKIVFYNTGITALLENNEQMLKKMESVFDIFFQNREEVALLWRPHPLIESTLTSMRPQLWKGYREIKDKYVEAGWGIYDDTPDLDRAVALSDVYYGDMSSVVGLFQAVKKVVMIQNKKIVPGQINALNCARLIRYQDRLFILTRDTQSLFEYCAASKKMHFCGVVGTKLGQLFVSAALYKHKIYFAPYEADEICVYDIEKEEFYCIPLKQLEGECQKKYYRLCACYQSKIYFLGSKKSIPLCLNTDDDSIKEISEWKKSFKEKYGFETSVKMHAEICIADNCFWVALEGDNFLLQYNMLTEEYKFWNVGKIKMQYITVNFDGENFWMTGNRNCIFRWNKETDEVKEYAGFPKGFEAGKKDIGWEDLFSGASIWNDNIYFVPLNSNMLVKLNKSSGKMDCVLKIGKNNCCFVMQNVDDENLYLEEDDMELFRSQSYCLTSEGVCRAGAFYLGTNDDIEMIKECIGKRKEMFENHPGFLDIVFKQLRMENEIQEVEEKRDRGADIFTNLLLERRV